MSETEIDVHKLVDYHARVETFQDALAFVMKYMDDVGEDPEIQISPLFCECEDDCPRVFYVSVRGRVEVGDE